MHVGGKTFEIKERQFFMVLKEQSVLYYPKDTNKWKYVWMGIDGELDEFFVKKMGFSLSNPVKNAPPSFDERILYSIVKDYDEGQNVSYYTIKSAFYGCLGALSEVHRYVAPIVHVVSEAKKIIEMNYTDGEFNLDSVATALNVSHSYLSKIFKNSTGSTLASYLISVRLKKAGELLLKTSNSAKEIAYTVGYNDNIHFFKEFKKYFGITTKEYRKKYEK
jgi:AraC family transcriptional regulator of arabinose operon